MRRRSLILLITALVVLSLLLASAWTLWNQRRMNQVSSEVALAVTQGVLSSTSATPLLDAGHPELTADMSPAEWQIYSQLAPTILGELQAIVSIRGGVRALFIPLLSDAPEAQYDIGLQFAQADAVAEVILRREEGVWLVTSFFIDSDLLAR